MKKEHLMLAGAFVAGIGAMYLYNKSQESKSAVVVVNEKSELIGGMGKRVGRVPCEMPNGTITLQTSTSDCSRVGGKLSTNA